MQMRKKEPYTSKESNNSLLPRPARGGDCVRELQGIEHLIRVSAISLEVASPVLKNTRAGFR